MLVQPKVGTAPPLSPSEHHGLSWWVLLRGDLISPAFFWLLEPRARQAQPVPHQAPLPLGRGQGPQSVLTGCPSLGGWQFLTLQSPHCPQHSLGQGGEGLCSASAGVSAQLWSKGDFPGFFFPFIIHLFPSHVLLPTLVAASSISCFTFLVLSWDHFCSEQEKEQSRTGSKAQETGSYEVLESVKGSVCALHPLRCSQGRCRAALGGRGVKTPSMCCDLQVGSEQILSARCRSLPASLLSSPLARSPSLPLLFFLSRHN